MAAIDKLYCYSKKDFIIFYQWCIKFDHMCQKETQKSIMDFLYTDLNIMILLSPVTFLGCL